MRKIIFLGTSYGMPKIAACSSIFIEDEANNILLDVGGGHEIIRQFYKAGKNPAGIRNIFLSHYDSDHILGIIPLVRVFKGIKEPVKINIFCSAEVRSALEALFQVVAHKHWEKAKEIISFTIISDGLLVSSKGWKITFFDLKSNKSPQFGCVIEFQDGKRVSFLGDEPLRETNLPLLLGSDILIHEAFCLDADSERFSPHPKNHSTAREAAINAAKAQAKMLVLCHMEDETLVTRKQAYAVEIQKEFKGDVFIPVDLDYLDF